MSPARERGQYYQEGRGGASVHPEQQARHHRSRRRRIPSGFTYISGCVKYTMFFFNFIFWLMGLLLIGVSMDILTIKNLRTPPIEKYAKYSHFAIFPLF